MGVRLESALPEAIQYRPAPWTGTGPRTAVPDATSAQSTSDGGSVIDVRSVSGPPAAEVSGEPAAPGEGSPGTSPSGGPGPAVAEPSATPTGTSFLEAAPPVAGITATEAPVVAGLATTAPEHGSAAERSAVMPAVPAPTAMSQPTPPTPSDQPVAASREAVVSVQPTPSSGAAALVPKRGVEEERAWLRRALSREYAAVANSVSRVLSEHPGFQGAIERSAGVLSDAVAIRLYLSGQGDGVDVSLRSGATGPHVPFARCVVSGLSRLPSHRGVSVFAASPTEREWDLYRSRKYFTDWGFVNALSAPCARQRQEHDVDVVLWSMTARRTKLLEPEQHPTPDRVLFVPGTSFKVLDLVEPEDGSRGRVLLRELAAGEVDESGRVDANRASLDELALNSLRRFVDSWADAKHEKRTPPAAASRFGPLPGLVRLGEEGR